MKSKINVITVIEDKPVEINMEFEFEPKEYVEVIKEIPGIIKQIAKLNQIKKDTK